MRVLRDSMVESFNEFFGPFAALARAVVAMFRQTTTPARAANTQASHPKDA